jgi:hypothetical protein
LPERRFPRALMKSNVSMGMAPFSSLPVPSAGLRKRRSPIVKPDLRRSDAPTIRLEWIVERNQATCRRPSCSRTGKMAEGSGRRV